MKRLTKEDIRKKYDVYSKRYDLIEGIGEIIFHKYRKKILNGVSGKVLEVGIGTGKSLKYYGKNCQITGVDFSSKMLERAKKRAKKLNLLVHLIKGDAENLHFKENSFDYVVDCFGLCTYPNPVKALKEMKRVLKKKGHILLLEHGVSSNKTIKKLQTRNVESHYMKAGCNLMRDYPDLVKKAGLDTLDCSRRFFGMVCVIVAEKEH